MLVLDCLSLNQSCACLAWRVAAIRQYHAYSTTQRRPHVPSPWPAPTPRQCFSCMQGRTSGRAPKCSSGGRTRFGTYQSLLCPLHAPPHPTATCTLSHEEQRPSPPRPHQTRHVRALLSSYADDTGVIDEAAASAAFAHLASGLPSRGGSTRTSLSGLPTLQPPAAPASVSASPSGDWSTLRPGSQGSAGPETAATAMPYTPPLAPPGRTSSSGLPPRTLDSRGGGAHVARGSLLGKALINSAIEKSMSGPEGAAGGGSMARAESLGSMGGAGAWGGGAGGGGGGAGAESFGSELLDGALEGGVPTTSVLDPVALCAVRAALQVG